MGLPVSQRRILQRIENGLRGSDPRLAALFSLFSRLNRNEAMPRIELIRGRVTAALAPVGRRLATFGRWFSSPRRARLRTALFFPVALGLVATAVLVGSSFPDNTRCTPAAQTKRVAHTSERAKRTKLICPPAATPVIIGR
jgi:hypothetical protein